MPENDKIIEAEQNIQDLAEELNKLHTSAVMLKNTHDQADAVITSTKRVIELTESYTNKAGQIISSLSEIDFEKKFLELHVEINQLDGSLDQHDNKLITMKKETRLWQILTLSIVLLTFLLSFISLFV
jgi:hypothetical protein